MGWPVNNTGLTRPGPGEIYPWFWVTSGDFAGGAKGDGITDDSAAVQAAITAAQLIGGVVFFPPGVYALKSSLILSGSRSITLRGSATATTGSRILAIGSAASMVALGDGASAANDWTGKLIVKELRFDANNKNMDIFRQQNLATSPGRIFFEHVTLWAFGTGYAYHDSVNNIDTTDSAWLDVVVAFGKISINLRNGVWTFINCTFGFTSGSGSAGVQLFANNKSSFYGCVWTGNVDDVVFAENGVVYTNPYLFAGCWFENATDACFASANASNQIDLTLDTCRLHHLGNFHAAFQVANSVIVFRQVDFGGLTPKVSIGSTASNNMLVAENTRLWNRGTLLATPFNTSRLFVGPQISSADSYAAGPTASTIYQVQACEGLWFVITGGTGVAVVLRDKTQANPIALAAGTPKEIYLPVGMCLNFGAFSVAPTVSVFPT